MSDSEADEFQMQVPVSGEKRCRRDVQAATEHLASQVSIQICQSHLTRIVQAKYPSKVGLA
jgi:hypothetical protein